MRRTLLTLATAAAALLGLTGCGPAPQQTLTATPPEEQLWTTVSSLSQQADGLVTTCSGPMPARQAGPAGPSTAGGGPASAPECNGTTVRGLDLRSVPGVTEYADGGATTMSVRLVGTYDQAADVLTVTQPPVPEQGVVPPPRSFEPPCTPDPAEPAGDPFSVFAYASSQPDAGFSFIDASQTVITVSFTGDLERHEAEIRALYDGPFCLVLARVTTAELDALQDGLFDRLTAAGLRPQSSSEVEETVEATVAGASDEQLRALEAEISPFLRLTANVTPVGDVAAPRSPS